MQFLSLSRRRIDIFPPEAFTPELVAREGQRVKELYAEGILRQIWKRGDIPGASILWEASSEAEVQAALDSLPISQLGMLEILAIGKKQVEAGQAYPLDEVLEKIRGRHSIATPPVPAETLRNPRSR